MSKGTFKTLCSINTALGGSNEGCIGNKDVLDRIAVALGASSSAKTKYSAEAMEAIAENIDDESPESIAALQIELARVRNEVSGWINGTLTEFVDDELTTIRGEMFTGFSSLSRVSCASVTDVHVLAFAGCISLTDVNLPAATGIGESAFNGCTSLSTINLPAALIVSYSAFAGCPSLENVSLPAATRIDAQAFAGDQGLVSVIFPEVKSVMGSAFAGCSNLATIEFGAITTIYDYAFAACTSLTSFTMDVASVPTISSVVFPGTPSTLTFYVPESMISAFQAAENWSAFSSQFAAIPEVSEETI